MVRRALFGRHGRKIIAAFCLWEIVALMPGSPVPTISEVVDDHPGIGLALLAVLAHHWFVEAGEEADFLDEMVEALGIDPSTFRVI